MVWLSLAIASVSMAISLIATAMLVRAGHRWRTYDNAGVDGQVKAEVRPIPNTGGIAIALAIGLPLLGAWLISTLGLIPDSLPEPIAQHAPGLVENAPLLLGFLLGLVAVHVLGLIDDRRPLPWLPKLLVTLAVPALLAGLTDTRLLTFLDPIAGGAWLSILLTTLWFAAITNAMNFLDNMDGLSGGVAAVASATFLVAALVGGQWFIAAGLALLLGACAGFLVFNFPRLGARRARIFMGDGGSLVLGYTLAFLTTRITYVAPGADWHATLMPLVVLAVPLYDLLSVTAVRLSQGRSPFVGDLQHFSHRLVKRGLSRRAAVLVVWALTAVTSIGGISLLSLEPWQAALVGVQTLLALAVLAVFERASSDKDGAS